MIDFFNELLIFLQLSTLTTLEETLVDDNLIAEYSTATYANISAILKERPVTANDLIRLQRLYQSQGCDVNNSYQPTTNIWLGASLGS